MRTTRLLSALVLGALLVSAVTWMGMAQAIPKAFANPNKPVRVALVREVGEGSFFSRELAGAQDMAKELGIKLLVFTAGGDLSKMVSAVETYIDEGVDAIIVDHGQPAPLEPGINEARKDGIKVVTFDLVVNRKDVPEVEQDDLLIGLTISEKLAIDFKGEANVIYINVGGYAPLEKRDRIWQAVKWRFPGLKEVAHIGAVTGNTASDTQTRMEAALKAHPEANAVLAMWDEFAKGAVRAIEQAGLSDKIKVYSVDINNVDIQMMIAPNSPWVATTATDSYNVGRLFVRAAAALVAGENVPKYLMLPPALVTRDFLLKNHITNMDELDQALPALGESSLCWYPWMKPVLERNGYKLPPIAARALGE